MTLERKLNHSALLIPSSQFAGSPNMSGISRSSLLSQGACLPSLEHVHRALCPDLTLYKQSKIALDGAQHSLCSSALCNRSQNSEGAPLLFPLHPVYKAHEPCTTLCRMSTKPATLPMHYVYRAQRLQLQPARCLQSPEPHHCTLSSDIPQGALSFET